MIRSVLLLPLIALLAACYPDEPPPTRRYYYRVDTCPPGYQMVLVAPSNPALPYTKRCLRPHEMPPRYRWPG